MNITVPISVLGTAILGTDANLSATTSLVIPAQSLKPHVTVTDLNDGLIEPDKTVIATMSAPDFATLGAQAISTVTIVNDLINSFNIIGVSGPGNQTPSAYLSGGLHPTLNWVAASNASSYDVTIYSANVTTIPCPVLNTAALCLAFPSCTLNAGASYKASIVARAGSGSQSAANSPFSFQVNQDPIPSAHGPYYRSSGASLVLPIATLLASDMDPDVGDTVSLTITGVSGSSSSAVSKDATNIT